MTIYSTKNKLPNKGLMIMKINDAIHLDLLAAQKVAYQPIGLTCHQVTQETESQEYGACTFTLNNQLITFRVAKITPTKIGQFVTLWKRAGNGPIMPFDMADPIDLFIISVRYEHHFGQFVFPKELLWQKGFVSKDGIGGKRAMRVYPPWNITDSPQAKKTQAWQLQYFVEIQPILDVITIKRLFFV